MEWTPDERPSPKGEADVVATGDITQGIPSQQRFVVAHSQA